MKIHFYFFTLFDSSILLHSTKNKVTDFLFQNHRKEKVGSKKERRLPEASAGPKNANTRNFPTTTKRWCGESFKDKGSTFILPYACISTAA